jgi:hypothetical protein
MPEHGDDEVARPKGRSQEILAGLCIHIFCRNREMRMILPERVNNANQSSNRNPQKVEEHKDNMSVYVACPQVAVLHGKEDLTVD